MKLRTLALVAGAFVCAPAALAEEPILYIIVDSSGSMSAPLGERPRIDAARNAVREELARADGRLVALQRLGGDERRTCEATDTLVPVGDASANASAIEAGLASLSPAGNTPLAAGLERAVADIGNRPAEIVLITDGADTCGRNICELAARWRSEERRVSVRIHGVGIDPQVADTLGCLNATTTLSNAPPPTNDVVATTPTFFEFPRDLTLWSLLNSNLIVAIFAAILGAWVTFLFGSVRGDVKALDAKAQAGLEVAQRQQQDDQADADEPAQDMQSPSAPDQNRVEAQSLIREAQNYLQAIASNDPDGRYRRTYNSIPESYFDILAEALSTRKRIAPEQTEAAKKIAALWKGYQRGKASRKLVPVSVVQEIGELLKRLKRR